MDHLLSSMDLLQIRITWEVFVFNDEKRIEYNHSNQRGRMIGFNQSGRGTRSDVMTAANERYVTDGRSCKDAFIETTIRHRFHWRYSE